MKTHITMQRSLALTGIITREHISDLYSSSGYTVKLLVLDGLTVSNDIRAEELWMDTHFKFLY